MSKEKALAKYKTDTNILKLLSGLAVSGFTIIPLFYLGFSLGTLFFTIVGMCFGGLLWSLLPNKNKTLPLYDIGTLVYHNPYIHYADATSHRLYEMSVDMDFTKILPVWTVVYHNEKSYIIECNGMRHEVSYRKQENLIPVLEVRRPKEIESKGIKN